MGTDEIEVAWSFIVKLIIVGENIYVPIDSVLGSIPTTSCSIFSHNLPLNVIWGKRTLNQNLIKDNELIKLGLKCPSQAPCGENI